MPTIVDAAPETSGPKTGRKANVSNRKTLELLEAVKGIVTPSTDYQVAKALNIRPQAVYEYRKKGIQMRPRVVVQAALLLGRSPFHELAEAERENEKDPENLKTWQKATDECDCDTH